MIIEERSEVTVGRHLSPSAGVRVPSRSGAAHGIIRAFIGLVLLLTPSACSGERQEASAAHRPEPIGVSECASCGMIVREQPSPRGQLVHRDGTRAFFCSIGDLIAYAEAPSSHGRIEQTWVEALAPDVDPAANDLEEERWVEASSAGFVLGVERDLIMGEPVLSFASASEAQAAAARLGGRAVSWTEAQDELGDAR